MQPTELQRHLESEVLEVEWSALKPHVERDALVLVGPNVPLVKAALAVALDAKDDVANWLSSGDLSKVDANQDVAWGEDDMFRFLIVQPFVLAQRVES